MDLVLLAFVVGCVFGVGCGWLLWLMYTSGVFAERGVGVSSPACRNRGRDPSVFSGRGEEVEQWLFSAEEDVQTLQPADLVGYVASFLEGNARLISTSAPDAGNRASDWTKLREAFRSAFAERNFEA